MYGLPAYPWLNLQLSMIWFVPVTFCRSSGLSQESVATNAPEKQDKRGISKVTQLEQGKWVKKCCMAKCCSITVGASLFVSSALLQIFLFALQLRLHELSTKFLQKLLVLLAQLSKLYRFLPAAFLLKTSCGNAHRFRLWASPWRRTGLGPGHRYY